jgi:hypothetical protein
VHRATTKRADSEREAAEVRFKDPSEKRVRVRVGNLTLYPAAAAQADVHRATTKRADSEREAAEVRFKDPSEKKKNGQ